jgi:hypothetical protein
MQKLLLGSIRQRVAALYPATRPRSASSQAKNRDFLSEVGVLDGLLSQASVVATGQGLNL